MDYRISVEEFEKEAEIMDMARNLVNEACEEIPNPNPKHLTFSEEEINIPILK
jgi:hypothetical protein